MKYNKSYLNVSELDKWDQFVTAHPRGNFLQTSHWSKVKLISGWNPQALVLVEEKKIVAGALIFELRLPLGRSLRYVPYGPLWSGGWERPILRELAAERVGLAVRLEPYYPYDRKLAKVLSGFGFHLTGHSYQPEETIILDLSKTEEELMGGMRQTTRRYIHQAERVGLAVREDPSGKGLDEFYRIMKEVSSRVGFGIHSLNYYQSIFREFGSAAKLFHVFDGGQIVGSYFLLTQGNKAWELYGGVQSGVRDRRANYLLKWEVIKAMKAQGITYYDQWGVAPEGENNHELSGVTYFKEGFGGERLKLIGAYELTFQPLIYRALLTLNETVSILRGLKARLHV